MSEPRFNISLPGLYDENWRKAYRSEKEDSPRLSSYQAPDGLPLPFIYKSLEFSGGQSIDTAEYPFFGLWSNETLNQKTQSIIVRGYLRGESYLKQRAAFLDALAVPTSDELPGFFDHPLWGRFKVVLENYNIQEIANENGQCDISLTLKRAGVSLEKRASVLSPVDFIKPEEVAFIAAEEFSKIKKDSSSLLQAFGQIKSILLSGAGKIHAAQTTLNAVTNEITGISNLISQGIQSPLLLAKSLVNASFSMIKAVTSIDDSIESVKKYFARDNKKISVLNFLSASSLTLPVDTITVIQSETKKETENLYRTVSLCAAADLLMNMGNITLNELNGYWVLYSRLENSINLENPDIYSAVIELRSALSIKLKQTVFNNELSKNINKPVPLLYLSHYLGCDDYKLRAMNYINDSFLVSGRISYV